MTDAIFIMTQQLTPDLPAAEVATILEAQLREEGALLSGHFKLSSGLHSDTYVQCARFLRKPDLAAPAMAVLAKRLRDADINPDVVVGPAMGGVVVSYELARQLGVPSLFTERDANGEMILRRGFTLAPGDRVVIAEDVVTTGKSTLEVARVLGEMGVEVLAVVSLIDRTNGAAQLPFPNFALLPVQAAVFAADAVPERLAGIPAVKPGSRPDSK
jgi:orotate phosphoribosyltransferase